MKIITTKNKLPVTIGKLGNAKFITDNRVEGYDYEHYEFALPSQDMSLETVVDLERGGNIVYAYEMFFEIPLANMSDEIPEGVSFREWTDAEDPPVTHIRTWNDLEERAVAQDDSLHMLYWQISNNGQFKAVDKEIIEGAGFTIYGMQSLITRLSEEIYNDIADPEYTGSIETIEYINSQWDLGGFYDIIHAYLNMREAYLAKGVDENAAWAACTEEEQKILVRWNQVGLAKANQIFDPTWSEGRKAKELGRMYEFFGVNMNIAAAQRFIRWWTWLQMNLKNSGDIKFKTDWDDKLKQLYIDGIYRQYQLGKTNELVEFTNTVIGGYDQTDFVFSFSPATVASFLSKTLEDKQTPI